MNFAKLRLFNLQVNAAPFISKSNFPFIRDNNNNNNKNSKWRQLCRPGVVTVNFEQISQIVLVFSLLTLNK